MLLALLLLAWASTNGWGQSEVLKSGNFNEGLSFYSYEQDKKISLGEDTWFISTSQYDNTNFYLGCNKEEMGLLSDSWDDVVTAIKTVKPDFRKNKEHAYAMRLQLGGSVLEGVNHIQFDWGYASANSSLDVYVFVDLGSGLEMAGQAEAKSSAGQVSCDFPTSRNVSDLVLVAIPDENKKYLRVTTYEITGSPAVSRVAPPVLTPGDGTTFGEDRLTVNASCSTEEATIYYTMDGSEPTTNSYVFPSEGLTISETTTVKAMAVMADGSMMGSEVVTATYTKKSDYIFAWGAASCTVDLNTEIKAYPELENTYPGVTVTYTSSAPSVATIDGNTGKIQLVGTGTAIITASIHYDGAEVTDSYSLVVTGLSASEETVAIVAQDDEGGYHAMVNTSNNDDRLDAVDVKVVNQKVLDNGNVAMRWIVDYEDGTICDAEGLYVAHVEKAEISLDTYKYKWKWNGTTWISRDDEYRALEYSPVYGYFKAYDPTTSHEKTSVSMPIVDGYTRSGLTSGNYGTICLPCAVAADDYEGVEFFTVAGGVKENGVVNSIVLEEVQTLEAGVPYIFCATGEELLVAYSGEGVESAGENNGLVGSFSGMDVKEGMYLLTADNEVKKLGEKGGHVAENRAYFDLAEMPEYAGETAGVNQRVIVLDDATGVSAVEADGEALVDVFSLGGVKVRSQVPAGRATDGLPKGIYVVNRQKVVVD